jgi:hypothetical protein
MLQTLAEANKGASWAYWGEHRDWLVAGSVHRDSDSLTRSNFRSIMRELGIAKPTYEPKGTEWNESEDACVETSSHWAVGWSAVILVQPESKSAEVADEIVRKLEDYPVVNESDWSEVEDEDYEETIRGCYSSSSDDDSFGDSFCREHFDPQDFHHTIIYDAWENSGRESISSATKDYADYDDNDRVLCEVKDCNNVARRDEGE